MLNLKKPVRWHQRLDNVVLLVLMCSIAGYLIHVTQQSMHVLNIILVLPVALLALFLGALEFFSGTGANTDNSSNQPVLPVIKVISLFCSYVLALPWLGLDMGTALFMVIFLLLNGEKKIHWALAYGLCFGFGVAWLFSMLLPYPMPMLILPAIE